MRILGNNCNNYPLSADQAESIEWEIPEVQSLADAIRKKGRRPFTRVESSLEAQIVAGIQQMAYTIYFGEDTGTRTVRVMTFLVDAYTQKVFVYDIVTDGFILLDKWRAKN